MHFEVLVEDISGKIALDILVPQIIGVEHTFKVHHYKGIGHIPKGLTSVSDPQKRILLDRLPKLIQGYGRSFANYPAILIVVCDLDARCLKVFRRELLDLVDKCHPSPKTQFCIAIEEGEAWYLGDLTAVKKAYPNARDAILNAYTQDSICGTWEKLADAISSGGARGLSKIGWQAVGKEKSNWAERITPLMDIERNLSPSFCYFRNKLQNFAKPQSEV